MRNSFEKEIAKQLKKAKVPYDYEQARLSFTITGWYVPDFTIRSGGGKQVFLEVKGYLRPETKRKMVGVKKQNAGADIRIVFQCKEGTKQGRQYSRWATKHGFPCAFGRVPAEWLN